MENQKKQKPVVNQDLCIACGMCASLCPDVFEQDPDTYKSRVKGECSADNKDCCQSAIDSCPAGAISWDTSN